MDGELYSKFLMFLVVVGGGVLMVAGIRANAGQSYWATKCMAGGGVLLFILLGCVFLTVVGEEYFYFTDQEPLIIFGCFFLGAFLLFTVGGFSLCARFGATCRRSIQLEEIASALAASESFERKSEKQGDDLKG